MIFLPTGVNSAEVDMVANTSNPHQNSFNSQESNASGLEVRMDNASGVSMQDNSGVNGAEEELLDEVSASGAFQDNLHTLYLLFNCSR